MGCYYGMWIEGQAYGLYNAEPRVLPLLKTPCLLGPFVFIGILWLCTGSHNLEVISACVPPYRNHV
jgi:hypothetical protein